MPDGPRHRRACASARRWRVRPQPSNSIANGRWQATATISPVKTQYRNRPHHEDQWPSNEAAQLTGDAAIPSGTSTKLPAIRTKAAAPARPPIDLYSTVPARQASYRFPPPPFAKPGSAGFTRPAGLGWIPPEYVPSPDWEQVTGRAKDTAVSKTARRMAESFMSRQRGSAYTVPPRASRRAILARGSSHHRDAEQQSRQWFCIRTGPEPRTGSWSRTHPFGAL